MPDEPIGAARVAIVGDYSGLARDYQQIEAISKTAGDRVANAFNSAAVQTKSLQFSVDQLKQKYEQLAAMGVRTEAQQRTMDATSQRLAIANDRLALAIQKAGHAARAAVPDFIQSSTAIRAMEGSMNIRAVEYFMSRTLGMGGIFSAIFPVMGGLMLGEILGTGISKVKEFYENAAQYATRFRTESNALNAELRVTNDELQVSNDRLEDEIGKLTGHPTNGLKSILDEAILAADKLEQALTGDLDKLDELLKKESIGFFGAVFSGRAMTHEKDFEKEDAQAKLRISQITRQADTEIAAAKHSCPRQYRR